MGTTDPKLRIFSAAILRRITGATPAETAAIEKIGLLRPNDHGRELYCLEDAFRVALFLELRALGLTADKINPLVPQLLAVDWTFEGSGVVIYAKGQLRLLLDAATMAAEVDVALTHLSVTLAAAPPE